VLYVIGGAFPVTKKILDKEKAMLALFFLDKDTFAP
jgi:hypothetical protein